MDISFVNGTDAQQAPVRAAVNALLNLDLSDYSFDWSIEFVDNPEPSVHNEFAFTDVFSGSAETRIRSDAPSFQPPDFNGAQFYSEVIVHELGHALLGQLAEEQLTAITDLFDTSDGDWDLPSNWEDRPLEGIVETFKDAFFPQALRRYANRTNRRIPISKYPEFRRLWREGLVTSSVLIESDLLDPLHAVGQWANWEGATAPNLNFGGTALYEEISAWGIGEPPGWQEHDDDFGDHPVLPPATVAGYSVITNLAQTLSYSFDIPESWWDDYGINIGDSDAPDGPIDHSWIWWRFFAREYGSGTSNIYAQFDGRWVRIDDHLGGGWTLDGDAVALGQPDVTIEQEFDIPADAFVEVFALFQAGRTWIDDTFIGTEPGNYDGPFFNDNVFEESILPHLPHLPILSRIGVDGTPIEVPRGHVNPGDFRRGQRLRTRPINGRHITP